MVFVCCFFFPFFVWDCALDKFIAKFWFGVKFKWTNNGLDYVGGQGCTISIDVDLISWFDLNDYFGKDFQNLDEWKKYSSNLEEKVKFSIFNLSFWGFKVHWWREE